MSSNSKGEKNKKITDYTIRNKETKERKESFKKTGASKRPIGSTSPTQELPATKKQIMSTGSEDQETKSGENLKELIGPLVSEMKLFNDKITKLQVDVTAQKLEVKEEIHKLEQSLITQRDQITEDLTKGIADNQRSICTILKENKELKQENQVLKERLDQIEINQLSNNLIITGIPENTWESYSHTKQRVTDTIASSFGANTDPVAHAQAERVEISYCTRIGRHRADYNRPISVTFQKKEDKDNLLKNKRNLPVGIYVNEEFPIHIKQARDKLRPILRMIKANPHYKDKCRIKGDKLIVNGISYTVDTLNELPAEISATKAVEKRDNNSIVFHGELSPFSNFYPGRFQYEGKYFETAEHYIQYRKALLSGDSVMANRILQCKTAMDAKKMSYKIDNFNMQQWVQDGYELCEKGIRAKFEQNDHLMATLLATENMMIAEASRDKLWGTGISLNDKDALSREKWNSPGWLSRILIGIRDDHK